MEWGLTGVFDVLAEAVPDRDLVVCGDVRRTYGEVATRSRGLAAFFVERGIGLQQERAGLERWERGQDAVALLLFNRPEYLESMYGAGRARATPANVNQRYRAAEIAELLGYLGSRAVVYQRSLGPLLASAVDVSEMVLVEVDDGSGVSPLPGSTSFESAVATPVPDGGLPEPSPDDLYLVCTGGTTGRPKAVLWRQADAFVAAMSGGEDTTAEALAEKALGGCAAWYATAPLMHAAAQWTAFSGIHQGGTVVLHDDSKPFDADDVLDTVERERCHLMSIVGDAYASPLVEALGRSSRDLSSLNILATGGAFTGDQYKAAILEALPNVLIIDGYGASETGGMAYGTSRRPGAPAAFSRGAGATVVSEDRSRFLEPGDDELGWTARRGRVPLGYLDDRAGTEATFPLIDGERVAVPGDRARALADGTIEMLGRDSLVVNTGGEKVFVEEVEGVLREHPGVADALVVGRPSDRFGQEVVAVVSPVDGSSVSPAELREYVAERIARFKAPRAVLLCDEVKRHTNGKADYRWAKEAALEAVDATGGPA